LRAEKLDTPMARTSPASHAASSSRHTAATRAAS
jgi:hypothetical protein